MKGKLHAQDIRRLSEYAQDIRRLAEYGQVEHGGQA